MATTFDYESYAREMLDLPTFEHLQGSAIRRADENISDFDLIKLKLLGMMSVAAFKGTSTTILNQRVESPICVGPLPPLSDVKLSINGKVCKAGAAIKSVCDQMGLLCAVPIE